jgi:hypothetical protein
MLRQLDQRHGDGLTVTLEWDPETDRVQVRCEDQRSPDQPPLCYPVDPRDARLAFLHPFALYQPNDIGPLGENPQAGKTERTDSARRRWYQAWTKPGRRADVIDSNDTFWWLYDTFWGLY